MPKMVVEIPEPVTPEEARLELACALYASRRLSFGQARELADIHTWDFWQELGKRQIPPNYDVAELEADIKTLKALGLW